MLISAMKAYGIQTSENNTYFAAAGSMKELLDLGYDPAAEKDLDILNNDFYGTKLVDEILCFAAGSDKKVLKDLGYTVSTNKNDIFTHGVYIWKKKYGKEKLIMDTH